MKHTNESGRSMVEMLGVLAIVGVLSVGAIAGYSKAMMKYKINKTTDQISTIVANIRTLFSSQGNYAGLTVERAIKFKVIPEDMVKNGTLKNAFNGDVLIQAAKARIGDTNPSGLIGPDNDITDDTEGNEAFIISYRGLPNEACITLATSDWGSNQASGLIAIAVGQGNYDESVLDQALLDSYNTQGVNENEEPLVAQPGSSFNPPIPVSAAVTACVGDKFGFGNFVAWKYR